MHRAVVLCCKENVGFLVLAIPVVCGPVYAAVVVGAFTLLPVRACVSLLNNLSFTSWRIRLHNTMWKFDQWTSEWVRSRQLDSHNKG